MSKRTEMEKQNRGRATGLCLPAFFLISLLSTTGLSTVAAQSGPATGETRVAVDREDPGKLAESLEGDFDTGDIVATSAWAESLNLADWLGPLAPVALSPFFGIALLSGLSLYGPDWVTDNALLGSSGPLQSQTLFWIFVALTLLTSLPRLTKVSKPFAQAVDRLETYAVIVILLIIKVVSAMETPVDGETQVAMIQFGVLSFTADTLLTIAMVVNVLVINSVKFFFEFLVWLTPVPFLDAVFEVCNKSVCAALMAIYAYSPTLATIINLAVLVIAALMLRWISRRVQFYRTMILDPILARLWSGFGTPKRPELIVFPNDSIGPFPAKSRLRLCRDESGDGWQLVSANWWSPARVHKLSAETRPTLAKGWVMHSVEVQEVEKCRLCFSRRYDRTLAELAESMAIVVPEESRQTASPDPRHEFA